MSQLDLHRNETTLWPFQKLQALQSHNMMKSNLGSLRDEEPEERLRQAQELLGSEGEDGNSGEPGSHTFLLNQAEMCCLATVFLVFTLVLGWLLLFSPLVLSDS